MIQGQNVNREGAVAQLSGDEVQNIVIRSGAESAVRSGFAEEDAFARYNFSFRARLIQATPAVQGYCGVLLGAVQACVGLRLTYGRRQVYVHRGRKQVAQFLFKGRTLCAAFALDPLEYMATKYHGEDVSGWKRFAKTPMLLRIVSPRKLRYALHLLAQAAGVPEKLLLAAPPADCTFEFLSIEQLIEEGLVKPL